MLVVAPVLGIVTTVGLSLFAGYGAFVAKVAVDALVQEALPDEYRGRAFALYDILYNLASVVAALSLVASAEFSLKLLLASGGVLVLALAWLLGRAMTKAGMFVPAAGTKVEPIQTSSDRLTR